jgi:protein gp37
MAQSSIEWTQMTWNPTTGCNKISSGCKHCYAEVMSNRLYAMGAEKYRNGFSITTHEDAIDAPYSWKKPQVVFVNSMSDLFHDKVPLNFIKKVFTVMNNTQQHTYQILTKRSERLREISHTLTWSKNIWMGVSVENEKVIHRIADLSHTNAIIKFLSIEPLIGPIRNLPLKNINWVIVGGESGHKARPLKKEWIEFIRSKCKDEDVSFFFKQWGKSQFNANQSDPTIERKHPYHAKGGCLLNGVIYRNMPGKSYTKRISLSY